MRRQAGVTGGGVEGDEVDLGRQAAEQFADGTGVVGRVVFPLDEGPLVEDAAAGGGAVGAACGHEFVERPFFRGGHEGGAFGLVRGVEGNREVERALFGGEAEDAGDDPDGAERDALGAEGESVGIAQDVDGVHDRVVVVERLAHAHEHEVAQAGGRGFVTYYVTPVSGSFRASVTYYVTLCGVGGAEGAGDVDGLGDDFAGREVARVAHLAGGAKHAAHRAADLAADAGRDAAGVAHEDGLDAFGVGEGEEVFVGEAVARGGLEGGGQDAEVGVGGEPRAEFRRQLGHGVERRGEPDVEIVPEPRDVHGVEVPAYELHAELLAREVVEVKRRGGHRRTRLSAATRGRRGWGRSGGGGRGSS